MKKTSRMIFIWVCVILLPILTVGCREDLWSSLREVDQVDFSPAELVDEPRPAVKVDNDPDDLLLMLHEMEKVRNNRWQSQTGWWHGQKKITSRLGDLHGVNTDWWFRFDGVQPCPELMQSIYTEDGQLLESNLLIHASALQTTGDGRQSSLDKCQPRLVKLPEQTCPDLLNQTLDRLENMLGEPNLNTLESTEAIIREGCLFITVMRSGPVREMVNVIIDLANGFIVEETERIYSLDDTGLLSEVTYQYHFDYFDQLPPEIRDCFDCELNSQQ